MELGKQGSSETSSDENDHRQEQAKEEGTANKRSYECTFCKRGFTNAQALGGHMNIHRKDRAKGKQVTKPGNSSLVSTKPHDEEHVNPNYFSPISIEPTNNYYNPVLEAQRNHEVYSRPPDRSGTNPRQLPHGYSYVVPERASMSQPMPLRSHEELWGANLSLRVGSNNEVIKGVSNDDDLDLELRLGHDP